MIRETQCYRLRWAHSTYFTLLTLRQQRSLRIRRWSWCRCRWRATRTATLQVKDHSVTSCDMCEDLQVTSQLQTQFISKYFLIFSSYEQLSECDTRPNYEMKYRQNEYQIIKCKHNNFDALPGMNPLCWMEQGLLRPCWNKKRWRSNQWEYKEGQNTYQMCFILSNIFFSIYFPENVLFKSHIIDISIYYNVKIRGHGYYSINRWVYNSNKWGPESKVISQITLSNSIEYSDWLFN